VEELATCSTISKPRIQLRTYKKAVPGETCAPQRQATLSAFMKTCPPAWANTITTQITEFIARDLRPISMVDGKGFQQVFKEKVSQEITCRFTPGSLEIVDKVPLIK